MDSVEPRQKYNLDIVMAEIPGGGFLATLGIEFKDAAPLPGTIHPFTLQPNPVQPDGGVYQLCGGYPILGSVFNLAR